LARLGRSRNMSGRVGVLDIRHEGRAPSRLTPGKRLQPVFNSPRRRLSSRLRRAALMISPRDPICAGETHRVVPHRDLYARDVKGVECRERRDPQPHFTSSSRHLESLLAKPNYRHAKRQKELARKTKQNEKLQRRSPRTDADAPAQSEPGHEPGQPTHTPSPAAAGERN
jgi:hypothetical protein